MKTLGSPNSLASWLEWAVRLAWFGTWIGLVVAVAWPLAFFVTFGVDGLGLLPLLGPAVINLALWLLILHRLLGFIGTLREARPFIEENGRRLRTIGFAVVGTWVVTVSTGLTVNLYAGAHFELELGFIELLPDFHLPRLFIGLMLLVIAEVFRIGARLQEEQDATI